MLFEFFNSTFLCEERKRGRGKEMGDGGREDERERNLEVKVGELYLVFLYTLRKNNYLT